MPRKKQRVSNLHPTTTTPFKFTPLPPHSSESYAYFFTELAGKLSAQQQQGAARSTQPTPGYDPDFTPTLRSFKIAAECPWQGAVHTQTYITSIVPCSTLCEAALHPERKA